MGITTENLMQVQDYYEQSIGCLSERARGVAKMSFRNCCPKGVFLVVVLSAAAFELLRSKHEDARAQSLSWVRESCCPLLYVWRTTSLNARCTVSLEHPQLNSIVTDKEIGRCTFICS